MHHRITEVTEYRALCNVHEDYDIVQRCDVDSTCTMLTERGQWTKVIVAPNGRVLFGHSVVAGARRLGWSRVLCTVVD